MVWKQKWPFVAHVHQDPYNFFCTLCKKAMSCGHQGEADVIRHTRSVQHQKSIQAMKSTKKLNFEPVAVESSQLKEKVRHQHAVR